MTNFKKLKDKLLFIPAGGCNFIGSNMYLYHFEDTWIAIDCGIGFSDKKYLGSDVLVVDLDFLAKYNIKLDALIITHSHEDHIGAVAYLIKQLNCTIYLTTFAKNFLEEDFEDLKIKNLPKMVEIRDSNRKFKIKSFEIEFFPITHSIVESNSIIIKTKNDVIFHTGDWKFDPNPVIGSATDLEYLKKIAQNNSISLLVCDSTNINKNLENQSEGLLFDSMFEIIKNHKNRILITTFASNLARIKTIHNLALKTKRKVVVSGYSLNKIIKIAKKSNYLITEEFIDITKSKNIPKDQVIILCTGCQAEDNASLMKFAQKKNKFIDLEKDDMVIFSSQIIPGNELSIFNAINLFMDRDIKVITNKDEFVHVSGHPYKNEILKMYDILKPNSLIPMHGERMMLQEHFLVAKNYGIKNVIKVSNGDIIEVKNGNIEKISNIEIKIKYLDGINFVEEDSTIFQEREKIAREGIIFIAIIIKNDKLNQATIKFTGVYNKNDKLRESIVKFINEYFKAFGFLKKNPNFKKKQGDQVKDIQGEVKKLTYLNSKKFPEILIEIIKLN